MNWLLCIASVLSVLTVVLYKESSCLILTEIEGPSLVVIDDENVDPIPLNCHFKVEQETHSLVVKWTKDNNVIFQYIKGHGTSVIPEYKNEIAALSSEPDDEQTGILLINPSIESSGIYRCHVQTDVQTRSMDKELHIIDIQNYTYTLLPQRIQNETHLECNIENVFPEPALAIIQAFDGESIPIVSTNSTQFSNGKFSASAIAVIRTDDESAVEYQCITTFDGLSFNLTTNAESGSMSFRRPEWSYLLWTSLLALVTYEKLRF
ncbi:PREDICTED: uncharacterized protein LOC108359280 [Rhagoletis zephyria]|uniref:uncharacterized protein LOC108359280 n=1 Tax=Rhagoletis zephyria TaxID=28612 RepID=UPI000811AA80|nr:PREDICTED: uncharacterized protein LOC108359280 [Rhagoletis zephyria]XP_036333831.1 uncharacterized protein LOC118744717 [Rhagoletis pomonella]